MRRRLHLPGNVDDLTRRLEQIFQEILQETIRGLYHSMSRRVAACIQARGDGILSVRAVSELVNLDRKAVRRILTVELHMKKICAKVILEVLSYDQKEGLKSCLRRTHFTSVEEIQAKTKNLLKGLPKTSFQNCYQQWQHKMKKCVNDEGDLSSDYFEGDNVTEN
ncbi:hypothetical protein TNCV_2052811 [Trichonephila clavipes]|nr:hypothetical protein TNCV_2052811 [Trichonephila clavipes]